jgi:hypothetical protein
MKLLAFFVTMTSPEMGPQDLFFLEENMETPIYLDLFSERRFTFYSSFFILLTVKVMMKPRVVPKHCMNSKPYWIT